MERRLSFLQNGHDLLEIKAESLLIQIKSFYKNVKDKRRDTIINTVKAFQDLEKAEVISKERALMSLIDVNKRLVEYSIKIDYRSSLGFTLPKITFQIKREKKYPHYGFIDTSRFLDFYYLRMQDTIENLVKLAELENTLFILANEYRKLRRRINALENIIIPQTIRHIREIENILEESEQEEFIRVKKIKEKIEKKAGISGF